MANTYSGQTYENGSWSNTPRDLSTGYVDPWQVYHGGTDMGNGQTWFENPGSQRIGTADTYSRFADATGLPFAGVTSGAGDPNKTSQGNLDWIKNYVKQGVDYNGKSGFSVATDQLPNLSFNGNMIQDRRDNEKYAVKDGWGLKDTLGVLGIALGGYGLMGGFGAGAGASLSAAEQAGLMADLSSTGAVGGLMTGAGGAGGALAALGAGGGVGAFGADLGATSIGGFSPSTFLTPELGVGGGGSLATALGSIGGGAGAGGSTFSSLLKTPSSLLKGLSSSIFGDGHENALGSLWDVGTGLYGLAKGNEAQNLTAANAAKADPFGPLRAGYAKQLQDLESDPTAIEKLPQYQAGLNAIQRTAASAGYLGSGNEKLSSSMFGANLYQSELQRLAGLAGAGINPGTGAQISQTGNQQSYQNLVSALNRIGTGVLNF